MGGGGEGCISVGGVTTFHCRQTICTPAGSKLELGVASFGVSVTTMEEVFIKVGEDSGESLDERWAVRGLTV